MRLPFRHCVRRRRRASRKVALLPRCTWTAQPGWCFGRTGRTAIPSQRPARRWSRWCKARSPMSSKNTLARWNCSRSAASPRSRCRVPTNRSGGVTCWLGASEINGRALMVSITGGMARGLDFFAPGVTRRCLSVRCWGWSMQAWTNCFAILSRSRGSSTSPKSKSQNWNVPPFMPFRTRSGSCVPVSDLVRTSQCLKPFWVNPSNLGFEKLLLQQRRPRRRGRSM